MKQFLLMIVMVFLFLMTMRSFCYDQSRGLGFSPLGTKRMYQQIAQTKQELNSMLGQLKQNTYLSELSMQRLLELIDLERDVVHLLIKQRAGYVVQKAVNTRNKALKRNVPSVVAVYDVVLDLATMHAGLERELRNYTRRYTHGLSRALNPEYKQAFLHHMMNTLEQYYHLIGRMQYASRIIK